MDEGIREFIEYCWAFYGPHQIYGEFFGHTLTRGELEEAVQTRIKTADFAGDTIDREAVRDIMLDKRKEVVKKRRDAKRG